MLLHPLFVSQFVLSALSITNLGLISSMVGFLHQQKAGVKTYIVNWPSNHIEIKTLPAHIWLDQGHTSNGVAGYGFFLGLLGMFIAFKYQKGKSTSTPLLILTILLALATLFTLSALIFTFVVTNQTKGQSIMSSLARAGENYAASKWTPETWYKAVLDIPLVDESLKTTFKSKIRNMEAWRWLLIPIFLTDIAALALSTIALIGARKETTVNVAHVEKAERYEDAQ